MSVYVPEKRKILLILMALALFVGGQITLECYGQVQEEMAPSCVDGLKFDVRVIGVRKAPGDFELLGFKIKLRLKFTNETERPIHLYKHYNSISYFRIFEPPDRGGQTEQISAQTILSGRQKSVEEISAEEFALLHKGESLEADNDITVFSPRKQGKYIAGSIPLGKHLLQVKVENGDWWPKEIPKIKERFGQCGILLHSLTSKPVEFMIP